MTTPTDSPQTANETAALVSTVELGWEVAIRESTKVDYEDAVIMAFSGEVSQPAPEIIAGRTAFAALLASLQQAERENALLSRDLNDLRIAYNLQAEREGKLRGLVEEISTTLLSHEPDSLDRESYYFHAATSEQRHFFELEKKAKALLAELTEGRKAE